MKISNDYYKERTTDEKFTLSEDKTSIYLHMKSDKIEVKVDGGIAKNIKIETRKCDYLLFDKINKITHLIELKGTIIDRAYSQLEETIFCISNIPEEKYLLEKLKLLEAYIVSPAPKIPKNVNSRENELAKMLAKKCGIKPKNIFDLIMYVKVVPKTTHTINENRRIIISGKHPLSI